MVYNTDALNEKVEKLKSRDSTKLFNINNIDNKEKTIEDTYIHGDLMNNIASTSPEAISLDWLRQLSLGYDDISSNMNTFFRDVAGIDKMANDKYANNYKELEEKYKFNISTMFIIKDEYDELVEILGISEDEAMDFLKGRYMPKIDTELQARKCISLYKKYIMCTIDIYTQLLRNGEFVPNLLLKIVNLL